MEGQRYWRSMNQTMCSIKLHHTSLPEGIQQKITNNNTSNHTVDEIMPVCTHRVYTGPAMSMCNHTPLKSNP